MAFITKILILGIIICLAPRKGRCDPPDPPAQSACSKCPDATISANLSDPSTLKSYESNLTARIWATGPMVPQTPLISELRDVLLEMSASDSNYFTQIAFMHAGWSVPLLSVPNLYLSLCPFAKVINDSLEYERNHNEQKYSEIVYNVASNILNVCRITTHASLAQTGCTNLSDPVEFPRDCYENGLVFCAEEVWNQFGRLMPWTLTEVFFKLYNSKIFLERAHAAVIAFTIMPAQLRLAINYSPYLYTETLNIFAESPDVSRCCCDCQKSRLDQLCFLHNQTMYANAAAEANGEICN